MKIGVIGDDDGCLRAAIEEMQRAGVVAEGFTLVGISTPMLGCGVGVPLEEPADPVCSGDPWVPFPGDIQKDE